MIDKIFLFVLLISGSFLFAQNKKINVKFSTQKDNSVVFSYTKTIPGSYYLKVSFNKLNNSLNINNVFYKVLKNKSGYLFKLRPVNKSRGISFSYSYFYIMGKPNPKIDTSFVYLLPFKEGKNIYFEPITKNVKEYFGAKPAENFYKYQFISKNPDTVCAVRKGTVISVVDKYSVDTTLAYSYSSERNRITIEHKDGTFADYTGFHKDKIFVKTGDIVYPGTELGVLDRYDKSKQYQLRLGFFFLKKPKSNFKSEYKYFTPYFLTSNGVEKLQPEKNYTVKVSGEIVMKEMKRKEKKKWKKKHKKRKR